MNLGNIAGSAVKCLKVKAPTILTGAGIGLGAATVVIVAKQAPKAAVKKKQVKRKAKRRKKKSMGVVFEIFKETAPLYLPAIITGIGAVACLVASNKISNNRLAEANSKLATAVAGMGFLQNKITAMQEATKEVLGKDKAEDIKRKTYEKMAEKEAVNGEDSVKESTKQYVGVPQLFYDVISKQFYRSSVDKLREAENKVNMIVHGEWMDGSVDVENMAGPNVFYELMGWDLIPLADAWIFPPRACFNFGNKGIGMNIGKTTIMSPWGEAALAIDFDNVKERWSCETRDLL